MAAVYTIGESLVDIIFKNGHPIAAKAGGSMLNTAVSLSRSGIKVYHISEYSNDEAGVLIQNFLLSNNIGTDYINRYTDGKTAIALAFLDKNKDAKYSFYKQYPYKRLQIVMPIFKSEDILLFGSFYSLQDEVRKEVMGIVREAKSKGCTIIYDPNIRNPHKNDMPTLRHRVEENFMHTDIVRASNQDFENIFGITEAADAWLLCQKYNVKFLLYTMNKNGTYHFSRKSVDFYPSKAIDPVSTIGAGDSFNAGLIKGILESEKNIEWPKAIEYGIDFATKVCMSLENYIPQS